MKNIIVFTSSTCPHCETAKAYLNEKGYKYTERNIHIDQGAKQEMMARKMMGVPAFIIGEESIVGLDKAKIDMLLDYTVESCPHCRHRTRVPKGKGRVRITCKQCEGSFEITTKTM